MSADDVPDRILPFISPVRGYIKMEEDGKLGPEICGSPFGAERIEPSKKEGIMESITSKMTSMTSSAKKKKKKKKKKTKKTKSWEFWIDYDGIRHQRTVSDAEPADILSEPVVTWYAEHSYNDHRPEAGAVDMTSSRERGFLGLLLFINIVFALHTV